MNPRKVSFLAGLAICLFITGLVKSQNFEGLQVKLATDTVHITAQHYRVPVELVNRSSSAILVSDISCLGVNAMPYLVKNGQLLELGVALKAGPCKPDILVPAGESKRLMIDYELRQIFGKVEAGNYTLYVEFSGLVTDTKNELLKPRYSILKTNEVEVVFHN